MPDPLVAVTGVTAGYGRTIVLRDVTLTVEAGELVGLLGPSGSGKTTLLRCLLGVASVRAGSVAVNGRSVASGRAHGVGYVPQLATLTEAPPIRVREFICTGLASSTGLMPWWSRSERAAADDVAARLGIGALARRPVGELSGGQLQRALIARALVGGASVLLLDEPTSGLDLATRQDILELLADLASAGTAVICTTHDLNWVAPYLPRLVCLHGEVIADGTPVDVLTPDTLRRTFDADIAVLTHNGRPVVVDAP